MKTIIKTGALIFVALLVGCSSNQTLEEYYVENSENPNFLSMDLPTSLLNLEQADLSPEKQTAIASLEKLNIIAFKKNVENTSAFVIEKANVKEILKNGKYEELMTVNTSLGRGTVSYSGETEAIDELIIYGDSDEKGFVLVRVLGDNMNPALMMKLMGALEKADVQGDRFKEIGKFFN